ncbi:MAG: site-2 protease family protein [Candidatus Sigynarchaeota archaeon]
MNLENVLFEGAVKELRQHGFRIQLSKAGKKTYKSDPTLPEPGNNEALFHLIFIPTATTAVLQQRKWKEYAISAVLFGITIVTVYWSAIFYLSVLDPVFGGQSGDPVSYVANVIMFMAGAVIIIFAHEMGHKIASDRHKIPATVPYLIPGPPPIGMFGAFVNIKDNLSTRNNTFDVALSGIISGLITSFILYIIGMSISTRISTSSYIDMRLLTMHITNPSATRHDVLEFIDENLNSYSILIQLLQRSYFPSTTWSTYTYWSDFYLPDTLIILHPLAFIGWVGIYLSFMNMAPISAFDGGHVFHAIFPQKWSGIVGSIIGIVILACITEYFWIFMSFGLTSSITRLTRKETDLDEIAFEQVPLSRSRKIVGVIMLVLMVFLFPTGRDRFLGIGY